MSRMWTYAYWVLTAALFALATWVALVVAPDDPRQGIMYKIFYVHLPIAVNTFVACLVVFVGSVGYLWRRQTWWDDLAVSAARVAVLLCTGVLLTGMIWGHRTWNTWWQWTPRLTFSFMLWLLYVVYLLVRASIEGRQRRAVVGAVYGLVAFLDVPLVYLSSRLVQSTGELHPNNPEASTMPLALALFFVPITMMTVGLIRARFRLERAQRAAAQSNSEGGEAATVAGGAA